MISRPSEAGVLKPHVKICGVTRPQDAALAVELGASAIGLVFWPRSPRHVSISAARDIVRPLPECVERIGVFVNAPSDDIRRITDEVPLSAVQLHGDEDAGFAGSLPCPVVKAVHPPHGRPDQVDAAWPAWVVLLVDAHDPVRRGGTGVTADWSWAAALAARRPVLLSGGLHADNVGQAMSRVRPYGLDVSSGVESEPGVKDPRRLRAFFAAVRAGSEGEME